MALWLCKQEPTCYSFDDLVRDGSTIWDGVSNPLARINLRKMKPGDRVFFYYTGKEKAIIGEMEVASEPKTDLEGDDKSAVVVEMRPIRKLPKPVSLSAIKADKQLKDWDLLRLPRLSVVPTTKAQWKRIEELSEDIEL